MSEIVTTDQSLAEEPDVLGSVEAATRSIHGHAKAIHEARRAHLPIIESLEAEKQRVEELLEDERSRLAKKTEWATERIKAAHRYLVEQHGVAKTFPTAYGMVKYEGHTYEWAPDIAEPDVFLKWAMKDAPGLVAWPEPKPPPDPRPDAVKARQFLEVLRVSDGRFVTDDGEVIPGVVAVAKEPTQNFKPGEPK